jgi:hypothetical protein
MVPSLEPFQRRNVHHYKKHDPAGKKLIHPSERRHLDAIPAEAADPKPRSDYGYSPYLRRICITVNPSLYPALRAPAPRRHPRRGRRPQAQVRRDYGFSPPRENLHYGKSITLSSPPSAGTSTPSPVRRDYGFSPPRENLHYGESVHSMTQSGQKLIYSCYRCVALALQSAADGLITPQRHRFTQQKERMYERRSADKW